MELIENHRLIFDALGGKVCAIDLQIEINSVVLCNIVSTHPSSRLFGAAAPNSYRPEARHRIAKKGARFGSHPHSTL